MEKGGCLPEDIKFVITDIDGVIIDRMGIFQKTFSAVLYRRFGISKDFCDDFFFETAGMPLEKQIEGALSSFGYGFSKKDVEEIREEFFEIAKNNDVRLFQEAAETVKEIKRRGLILCATSGSNGKELEEIFFRHGLEYDLIIGSDRVPKSDIHIDLMVEHFLLAKEDFCRQAIYLGDGPPDMEIAKRNGIYAVGITNTVSAERLKEAGADAVIERIEEILEYVI